MSETSVHMSVNKTEQAIQESNTLLLDIVQAAPSKKALTPQKKKISYPENQITPLLDAFENHLSKKREAE